MIFIFCPVVNCICLLSAALVVKRRRRCVVALHTMNRIIKLVSRRRRLLVAVLFAATTAVILFAVGKLLAGRPRNVVFSKLSARRSRNVVVSKLSARRPRYVVFGVDRHPSVLRLLSSDILITRLDDGDDSDDETTPETVGVFVVMLGLSMSHQTMSQPGAGTGFRCIPSHRHQIFIITSATSESSDPLSWTSEDRKQHGDNVVNTTARQIRRGCVEAGLTSVIVWQVQVSGNVTPSVVSDLVTEAYVDNITWYDVIFLRRMTSLFPVWGRWPAAELSLPSHVGVAVRTEAVGTRVAFHRTHLEIFGDSWPYWIQTDAEVARYLKDVYADSSSLDISSILDGAVRDDRTWLRRQVSAKAPVPVHTGDKVEFNTVDFIES